MSIAVAFFLIRAIGTVYVSVTDTVLGNTHALVGALKLLVGAVGTCGGDKMSGFRTPFATNEGTK